MLNMRMNTTMHLNDDNEIKSQVIVNATHFAYKYL